MDMKKYIKTLSIISLLISVTLIFSENVSAKRNRTIPVSLSDNITDRIDTESTIFKQATKNLGIKLAITWSHDNDLRQISQINTLVSRKPNSIIIGTNSNSNIMRYRLNLLQNDNIKVLQYDSVVNGFTPDILFTFNYEALGRNLAFEALKNYDKGNILILMSKDKKLRSMLVVRGFLSVVSSKTYENNKTPEVKVVEVSDELRPVISTLTSSLSKNHISIVLSLSSKISKAIADVNQNSLLELSDLTLIGVGYRYQSLLQAMQQSKYKHIILGYTPYKNLSYATVYTFYYNSYIKNYKLKLKNINYNGKKIPAYLIPATVITDENKTALAGLQ